MTAQNDPFISVPVQCPICDRDSRQRYVKSKLYTPSLVESDQHVVEYSWESPKYEGIRPNFYHIWHCPHCHFSDEKEVFRGEDNSGGKLELIREKLLIASRAPDSFVTRLGQEVDLVQEYVTLESALCAHLLATYIQEMLSPNMRQYQKLGKFYLRTAWLYREKAAWNAPETGVPQGFDSYRAFFESLQEEWPNLPLEEEDALDKAIVHYREDLDRSKRVDDVRYEVTVTFLLAELYRRLDRLDDTLKAVRTVFQLATRKRQGVRQALDSGISKGKGTQQQIEGMRSLISWLNNAIDRATNMSEEVNEIFFRNEYPAAREAVLAMDEPTPRTILGRLREKEFHEITCRRVVTLFKKHAMAADLEQAEAEEAQKEQEAREARETSVWTKLVRKIRSHYNAED